MRLGILAVLLLALTDSAVAEGPTGATVSACFTPGPIDCAGVIVEQIAAAQRVVLVQAYYLTSPRILQSLAAAKRRGLDVAAILDKSQDRRGSNRSRYSGATYLANAGIPVWIDSGPAIAHSKVVVIDEHVVITGSFNFTRAAAERNAENVVVLDSPEVANWFAQNWETRRAASYPFVPQTADEPDR